MPITLELHLIQKGGDEVGVNGMLRRADDMRKEESQTNVICWWKLVEKSIPLVLARCQQGCAMAERTMYLKISLIFIMAPTWSSHTPLTARRKRSPSTAYSTASALPPSAPVPAVPLARGKAGTMRSSASRSRYSATMVLNPEYSCSPSDAVSVEKT